MNQNQAISTAKKAVLTRFTGLSRMTAARLMSKPMTLRTARGRATRVWRTA